MPPSRPPLAAGSTSASCRAHEDRVPMIWSALWRPAPMI